jgi:hypothetical protein
MINFYWPFKSLNLEDSSEVNKRLKFLKKLINAKNAKYDYAIQSRITGIKAEIKFLKSVLKKSKYAKSNINFLKNEKLGHETANSSVESGQTAKKINNNHLKTIKNGKF